jgi:hypothetical protein
MVGELVEPYRSEPPYGLAERPMLEAWLKFHRATLQLKCQGLDAERLAARPVPTSALRPGRIRRCRSRPWRGGVLPG